MMERYPHAPRVRVRITPEIIDASTRRSSSHCMIAEAIKEAVPNAKYVAVDIQTCRFTDRDKGLRYTYLTPRKAQQHIIDFDQGEDMEPISFELREAHVTACNNKKATSCPVPSKAKLGAAKKGTATSVRRRVGGKPPPRIGIRREYGLRAYSK